MNETIIWQRFSSRSVARDELGLSFDLLCRDNPFTKMARTKMTRSVDRGLARIEPVANVLVAYAAKDGTTALDGNAATVPTLRRCSGTWGTPGWTLDSRFAKCATT